MHRLGVAQLEAVGEAEQAGAHGEAARHPVAEDHRREADEASAVGLAVLVEVGRDQREVRAGEAREGAGHDDREVLVLVDVDAQRLGRGRVLAAGAQPQAEHGAPEGEVARHDQRAGQQHDHRDVGDQAAEHTGDVRDHEPVVRLDVLQPRGEAGDRDVRQRIGRRGLVRAGTGGDVVLVVDPVDVGADAGDQQVDADTGDDVVDAEGHRDDGVQQTAQRTAEHARHQAEPRVDQVAAPGAAEGAGDHHAFEADVDDAGPLGPETAETGHADRHGGAERGGDLTGGGQRVVAGDDADDREEDQGARDQQQHHRPGHLALLGGSTRRLGAGSGGRAHADTSFFSAAAAAWAASSAPTFCCWRLRP